MSRVETPKGMPKYLYNPRNGRVMVATQEKFDRVDEYDRPYFIPCESPEGPNRKTVVTSAKDNSDPVIGNVPDAEASKVEVKGATDLLDTVMASEDKDELVQIGTDLGITVRKTMKIETMQSKIAHKLAEMDIL